MNDTTMVLILRLGFCGGKPDDDKMFRKSIE
jgi:hypothetical protein